MLPEMQTCIELVKALWRAALSGSTAILGDVATGTEVPAGPLEDDDANRVSRGIVVPAFEDI